MMHDSDIRMEDDSMKHIHILYNPHAGNNTGRERAEALKDFYPSMDLSFDSVCDIADYGAFFASLTSEDTLVLCGGDGTLNRFVNDTAELSYPCDIYFFPTGTGNDFLRDLGKHETTEPVLITPYLKNLPVVTVNGKCYRFLNNVGFGIDGYCCEVGDKLRAENKQKINYTAIAIKGLLFFYRPTSAIVMVDGKKFRYRKVWIAPTMKGRFYGGGMMPAPAQDRLDPSGKVSVVLMHGAGKLRTLMAFPSIFEGKLLTHQETTALHEGYSITVRFDSPRTIQIDGETITGVSEYTVEAKEA